MITKHAKKRMTQRFSVSRKKDQDALFQVAVQKGYNLSNFRDGEFRTYLEKLERKNKYTSVKIYNNKVFIHRNKSLITAYEVPRKYGNTDSYLHYSFIKKKLQKSIERKYKTTAIKFRDVSKVFIGRDECFVFSISIGGKLMNYGIGKDSDLATIDAMNRVLNEGSRIEVK